MLRINQSVILLCVIALSLSALSMSALSLSAYAGDETPRSPVEFSKAADSVQRQLEESIAELNRLREQAAAEKIPLSRELSKLESELSDIRLEYQQTTRLLDSRTLDLSNFRTEINSRNEESLYLSNLLGEYIRNFESRLHIAEIQRYREPLEAAKLAAENTNLTAQEVFEAQAALVAVSVDRLEDSLGGSRFEGTAVDAAGMIQHGTFILVGPVALFRSDDGKVLGTVEQRLGSLEPSVVPFGAFEDALSAEGLFTSANGLFPFDPTLGNAHKIEATEETLWAHIRKGGPVMAPILGLAAIALLVAVCKWFSMAALRQPSQSRIRALLNAVARRDGNAVKQAAAAVAKVRPRIVRDWLYGGLLGALLGACLHSVLLLDPASFLTGTFLFPYVSWVASLLTPYAVLNNSFWIFIGVAGGAGAVVDFIMHRLFGYSPVGRMLAAGVEHIREPPELIEEVMYEEVLSTRLKVQRLLPFVGLSASSAPLLGLLGTVTGIINTFKLMTVYGSGDIKTLSSGISEALITTEFGLYVAIPSLLIYAFLSRKARGIVDQMEKAAVAFVNQVSKSPRRNDPGDVLAEMTPEQVRQIVQNFSDTHRPAGPAQPAKPATDSAGVMMDERVVSVDKTDTVAEALGKIRTIESGGNSVDTVFVVDEQGRYAGHVPYRHLLTQPEQASVESLADTNPLFVRVDTHPNVAESLLSKHNLISMPVLDHEDQLVGRILRKGNGNNGGNGNGK